jgi:broad specificity phosphatase PhoE
VLLLVRHGRSAPNASRRLLGRLDVPLDDLGHQQADALGRLSALHHADRVVSSPLLRARETAARLGPPVTVDARWTEIDYGVYDGEGVDTAPELWNQWNRNPDFVPAGGESLAALGRRVRQACDELWPDAAERDVVVVTHVSPIKAAVAWALGVGDQTSWRMFVDVASVTRIGPGAGSALQPALRSFNDTHHRPSS